MGVGRPEYCPRRRRVGEAGRGDVVGQRVDPDVHHVLRVAGHRHAPGEGGPADREVREAALHEGDDLVQVFLWRDEIGMGRVMGDELVGVGRQAEEPALLLHPVDRRAGRGELGPVRAGLKFALVEIGLVAHRIPAGVFRQVDVAVGRHALPDRLHRAGVAALVVRTMSSARALRRSPIASNSAATRSTNSCGVTPSRAAACCTLRPYSSMPVTNSVSRPSSRMNRWIASAAMRS